jgi:predicted ATPase
MAAVTAVITANGDGHTSFHPALALVAAIALAGLAVTLAGVRQGQEAAVPEVQEA